MLKPKLASSLLAALVVGGFAITPTFALASDHHDKGHKSQGHGHAKDDHHNQGKSPKDHGRHDNRDQWWKDDHHSSHTTRSSHDYRSSNRSDIQREYDHRQQTKNEWRNIAYVSGGVALLGLLKHDNTLTFAGTAGALYSLYRYEQDRKSQNSLNHLRASYFSRPYFVRDGHRYDRVVVVKNGQKYYQFRRH